VIVKNLAYNELPEPVLSDRGEYFWEDYEAINAPEDFKDKFIEVWNVHHPKPKYVYLRTKKQPDEKLVQHIEKKVLADNSIKDDLTLAIKVKKEISDNDKWKKVVNGKEYTIPHFLRLSNFSPKSPKTNSAGFSLKDNLEEASHHAALHDRRGEVTDPLKAADKEIKLLKNQKWVKEEKEFGECSSSQPTQPSPPSSQRLLYPELPNVYIPQVRKMYYLSGEDDPYETQEEKASQKLKEEGLNLLKKNFKKYGKLRKQVKRDLENKEILDLAKQMRKDAKAEKTRQKRLLKLEKYDKKLSAHLFEEILPGENSETSSQPSTVTSQASGESVQYICDYNPFTSGFWYNNSDTVSSPVLSDKTTSQRELSPPPSQSRGAIPKRPHKRPESSSATPEFGEPSSSNSLSPAVDVPDSDSICNKTDLDSAKKGNINLIKT
jgi:hypothetical protein